MLSRRESSLICSPHNISNSAMTLRYSAARKSMLDSEVLCGRWRKSTYICGKLRFSTKHRLRAESQMEEKRKPSKGERWPVMAISMVVFTMEQIKEPKGERWPVMAI